MGAASATAGNKYQSSTGLLIVTYVGDVTKAVADGIVVSEGKSFRGMGYVAKTLVRTDSEFDTNRNKLIQKEKANFTPWRVYTTGKCAKFLSVFHAIVIPRGEKEPIQEWKGKMASLYKIILQEAEKKGISILAVPLLGSGKIKVKPADAVEVAVHAMFSYKRTSLFKVLLVSNREDIVDQLATQCAYTSSVTGGKPLYQRPPPNIKAERPLPQPPSSNAKSKSKLGGGTDNSCSSLKRKNGDRSERTHENVVKQMRLAPQRRNYEEEDGDEINDDDEEEEDTSEQENTGRHVGGRIGNQEQPRRELATTSTESATVSAHIPRPSSQEDEMKEQLSCPVCLDLFTDPVILQPCCHTLCSECAETIRSQQSSFKCPMCMAVVQNGPLQRNFHLEGTVSIYRRQRKISNSMN
ncbi:uncharacterized protein LOC124131661 isoform X2 [Haliotis rufescens]|uniref:uncharacterized protein LOC124131661 isoform X2 n=1 Tax=Haliotis rufescens TaxID=6454 RepID=UPI00201E92F5|nr:uncharacterized protein LOC124131661 isoform X2 [Haliotis rufescens]